MDRKEYIYWVEKYNEVHNRKLVFVIDNFTGNDFLMWEDTGEKLSTIGEKILYDFIGTQISQ